MWYLCTSHQRISEFSLLIRRGHIHQVPHTRLFIGVTPNFNIWFYGPKFMRLTRLLQRSVTALVRGSLEGPKSNLERCYIIVRLAVCLSTSGKKIELVGEIWRPWVGGGGAVRRVNTWRPHAQTSPSSQSRYIVMLAGGLSPYRGSTTEREKSFDQTPLSYHPESAYTGCGSIICWLEKLASTANARCSFVQRILGTKVEGRTNFPTDPFEWDHPHPRTAKPRFLAPNSNQQIMLPHLVYIHTDFSRIREPPLLRNKLHNPLTKSHPTLNPGTRARISLSEVRIYSEPSNWSVLIPSTPSPLAPI
jgi:hypothetical protein